ncbi:hypothetical protein LK996_03930 [Lysobacter sp. A6]|uniref:Pertussis toxin subunit 1 n=1 Tax=Noviluteimonas lactosilytica TaxID=2888523 RepID=A0ABS8JF94_9GAMM|nr:hypothetical protein [Lysobacter lactosilyticus]MCC8362222.1 hypothetical protein [Lysobacter lactosilyticus]
MLSTFAKWAAAAAASMFFAFPAHADPILLVYRADTRPPHVVFQGISGRGSRMDLLAHTLGGACDETDPARASMWVSTSAERQEAVGFIYDHIAQLSGGARMWVYTIRPDVTYFYVPSILNQVADAGERNLHGYTPQHADVIDHLLRNSRIVGEAEVLTHHVASANIINATPVWFGANGIEQGATEPNPNYVDLTTFAVSEVDNLAAFVPPASIRLDLLGNNGGPSTSDQCAMTCDGASSASSFSATQPASLSLTCDIPKRASPAVLDIILGY